MTEDAGRPLLHIVRGTPDPAELAAVVAVIAARSGGDERPATTPVSRWASKAAALRRPLAPGPGAWTHSLR